MIWPFKKSSTIKSEKSLETPPSPAKLSLSSSDDDITRAMNLLQGSGIGVNDTVYSQIVPWMAIMIRTYQDLDRAAFENEYSKK